MYIYQKWLFDFLIAAAISLAGIVPIFLLRARTKPPGEAHVTID